MKPRLIEAAGSLQSELIESIDNAKHDLYLETMSIDSTGDMQPLIRSLRKAALRGVNTQLVFDRYSFFDCLVKQGLDSTLQLREDLTHLKKDGVQIRPVGDIRLNPCSGRHHIKTYVADDIVFTGGGANLTHDTFATKDFMLRYENRPLSQQMPRWLHKTIGSHRDSFLVVDDDNTFIIDGGRKGASPIYDTAVRIAKDADTILVSSKMIPDGELAAIAQTRPVSTFLYNRRELVKTFNWLALEMNAAMMGEELPLNSYIGNLQLHAKFCATLTSNGLSNVLTGSHNFNRLGVDFGTRELVLYSKDREVFELIDAFAQSVTAERRKCTPV